MEQEFVTLPREVVEQVRGALAYVGVGNASENPNLAQSTCRQAIWKLDHALRAALEQPQNHAPDTGNMASAGWKLVPVEPTLGMIEAGKDAHYEAEKRIQQPDAWKQGGFAKRAVRAAHVFQAMLDAAPQPPAPDQPQSDQPAMTPIAQRKLDTLLAEGYTISGYSVYHEQKHQHGFVTGAGLVGWWKPEGMEYPQPRGEQDPVGEAAFMPGTTGFTMACFLASDVPVGTKLYTHPQPKSDASGKPDEWFDRLKAAHIK